MEELEEITRPSAFLWHKVLLNCFMGIIAPHVPESKWWKMSQKSSQETSKCHRCGRRVMGDLCAPLEKAKATWLRYWLPSSAVQTCSSQQNLSAPFFPQSFALYAAALIRGNRNNCTQFSRKLDWLVSKLERLESSSGNVVVFFFPLEHCQSVGMLQNGCTFCLLWLSQASWKCSTASWLRVLRLWTSFRELTLNL